jgi:hypothetical protein
MSCLQELCGLDECRIACRSNCKLPWVNIRHDDSHLVFLSPTRTKCGPKKSASYNQAAIRSRSRWGFECGKNSLVALQQPDIWQLKSGEDG